MHGEFYAETTVPVDRWITLDGVPGVEFTRVERANTWLRYRLTDAGARLAALEKVAELARARTGLLDTDAALPLLDALAALDAPIEVPRAATRTPALVAQIVVDTLRREGTHITDAEGREVAAALDLEGRLCEPGTAARLAALEKVAETADRAWAAFADGRFEDLEDAMGKVRYALRAVPPAGETGEA